MKNLKKRKGFTLIELMIVLAIIGILGVVLVPKTAIFKKQAKTQGVITNVNTVRAYLETRTSDSFIGTASGLQSAMALNFSGTETIENPSTGVGTTITDASSTAPASTATSVAICGSTLTGNLTSYKGMVVILVDNTNTKYTVYGVDLDGNKITKDFVISK